MMFNMNYNIIIYDNSYVEKDPQYDIINQLETLLSSNSIQAQMEKDKKKVVDMVLSYL